LRALGIANAHLIGHSRGGYVTCRMTVDYPELAATCTIINSNTCAPGTGRNEYVFANNPEPALSRAGQRWVLEKYSYDPAHVTEAWLDALVGITERPEYRHAVSKMTDQGFLWTKFLPGLHADKEEMFRILAARGIQRPVLQVWSRNDETVSHAQAEALFRILAEKERRARWQIFDRAAHFSYREHPKRFNEVIKSFVHAA
jgi:pimeloyl-ACP methyl ester carboxylesterase